MKRLLSILKLMSSLLLVLTGILLLPIIIAIIYNEPYTVYMAFAVSSLISLVLGLVIGIGTRKHKTRLDGRAAMILCTFAWLIISLIGALPFIFGLNKSFIDAFFESVSGLTTTGITVFEGLDTMSPAILFWRSLIQWLGGLGILTFFLFVSAGSDGETWQLFSAEGHKIASARPVPNVFSTVKIFWLIYGGLTVIEMVILYGLGLDLYEALLHSLTTLSTGGFSNHDASIAYYKLAGYKNYQLIEYTIIFFMLLGGINFLVHYKMLKGNLLIWFKDIEARTYLSVIAVFSTLTIIGKYMVDSGIVATIEPVFRKTLFQIVSVMTTTGFGTEDIGSDFFPSITKQLFIVLMITGGCVGSTSGGIKILRGIVLSKLLKREVEKIHLPRNAVLPVVIGKVPMENNEIMRISALVFGWLFLIFIGSGITALFSDLGPFEAFSGMASAVGNIGPFYFTVGKMASLSPVIKVTYIIGMLAGRLELLPLYIMISRRMWIGR